MRGRGRARRRAVARFERARRERDVAVAGRARDQRADDDAHHAVQERVAAHRDPQQIVAARERDRAHLAHRAAAVRALAAERREVVLAQQRLRRREKARAVDRAHDVPRARAPHRRRKAAVEDEIVVDALARVEARGETVVDDGRVAHDEIGGRVRVEHQREALDREVTRGRERHDLPRRVHAGVGAPGGGDLRGLVKQPRERVFQRAGDGAQGRLELQSVERAPVVFDDEPVRRHAPRLSGNRRDRL